MNNKLNKTKVVLFASLIVAMILPFSGMDSAEAIKADDKTTADEVKKHLDKKTTKDKINEVKKLKQEQRLKLDDNQDKSQKTHTENFIKRLDIVEALLTVKDKAEKKELTQEVADKKAAKLLKELDSFYIDGEEQYLTNEHSDELIQVSHNSLPTTYFQTTTQSKFNCDTISTDYGYNYGGITPIDLVSSTAVFIGGYPESISIMENNYCTEKDYYSGHLKMRNLSNLKTCNTNINPHNDVDQGTCYHIGLNAPVLVTAYALYDGFIPFNITEGVDYITVGS